ncbi:hypothetical protein PAMP_004113 [Pampus punctatissimus]
MDTLLSDVDKLCMWLSSDPDYILDQCGDILTRNEYKEVEKQRSALDKMETLLKIMQKGEDKAQSFLEILRQHQAHYTQLQQFFKASAEGSSAPSQFADDNSVITTREMTNTKAKSISMKIETVSHPGSGSSGNVAGQILQADFAALGRSVICADKISNCTIDGNIDLSVTVKPAPHAHAGTVNETLPSSQGPAMKMITGRKRKIIDCLATDHTHILQTMHERNIVDDRKYNNLKHQKPEEAIIDLIDYVIANGEEACSEFLQILKEPDCLCTFRKLKEITKN